GDDDRLDVLHATAQVGEVRQHEVDPDHLRSREAQADVDDDDPVLVLDDRHVLADLPQATERQHSQGAHAVTCPSRSWRMSIARTASRSAASDSTIGRGRPQTRWANNTRA